MAKASQRSLQSARPTVGISLGCPSGIGPEIVANALADRRVQAKLIPIVFGDGPTFERFPSLARLPVATLEGLERARPARVHVTQLGAADRKPGKPSRASGHAQLQYIEAAVQAALRGTLDAICTAPVSKEQIARTGFPFSGHTELLAERFGVEVLMLLDGPRVRVALSTNHLPLAEVPAAITRPRLVRQLKLLSRTLAPLLDAGVALGIGGGRKPRIAVCGLNPHAGDGGLLGKEELQTISPAIAEARRAGIDCRGPFAADGLFAQVGRMPFDVVLALYHDQGLVAAKALDFVSTVNVTLGLPVPRTSPDHGTAYDIAGKNRANAEPMIAALLHAALLAAPR